MTELLRPFVVQFRLLPAIQNDYAVFSLSLSLSPPLLSHTFTVQHWVPVLHTWMEVVERVDHTGSACHVTPLTPTLPWNSMLCLHPPLIVEMSLCPVQGAAPDGIREGYVLHIVQCLVYLSICLSARPWDFGIWANCIIMPPDCWKLWKSTV